MSRALRRKMENRRSITFPLLRGEQNSDSLDEPEELAMSELFSPEVSGIHMKLETTGGEEQLALYARCFFENMTESLAENILLKHGSEGTFLVTINTRDNVHFIHLLLSDGGSMKCVKYPIQKTKNGFTIFFADTTVAGSSLEEAIAGFRHHFATKGIELQPIFCDSDQNSGENSLGFSVVSPPPEYSKGKRYPNAPMKNLPSIKGLRTSLIETVRSTSTSYGSITSNYVREHEPGCCYHLCHCDPGGDWWKPHKAGPCMAVLLVIGWMIFLLLFGWAIAIFVFFGVILLGILYMVHFICTCSCTGDPLS